MDFVRNLFWGPDEMVVQFFPPTDYYHNRQEDILHLWKYLGDLPEMPESAIGWVKKVK